LTSCHNLFLHRHQMTPDMAPADDKVRVTARISKDLDTRIHRFYNNMAPAIIEGLELIATNKENNVSPNGTNENIEDTKKDTKEIEAQLSDKEKIIGDKKKRIEDLEQKIGDRDIIISEKEKTIGDKEKEIEFLKGQITIKDQQIDKQAFSLQSLIQENSRLNLRLLPESQETKTQEHKINRWQYLKGFVFGSK
jgi:uncharacterized protein (DUF3084 family)